MARYVAAPYTDYVFIEAPPDPIVRVGKRGFNLWIPKDWNHPRRRPDGTFGDRFDDPGKLHNPPVTDDDMFRMIYAAGGPEGAICETAAYLRPKPRKLRNRSLARRSNQADKGVMDEDWCSTRKASFTSLNKDLVFVDVASHQTANALSEDRYIAHWIAAAGYSDVDPLILRGPNRRLTQEVARYIWERTEPGGIGLPGQPPGKVVAGIHYLSRHGDGMHDYPCWALFDKRVEGLHNPSPDVDLSLDDTCPLAPHIKRAAEYLGLVIE